MPLKVGSNGPLVKQWQELMVRRFASYAKAADGGPLKPDAYFGYDDSAVAAEWQRRVNRPITGQVSDEELTILGLGPPPDTRPLLLTVCGTGVPWWVGPDADTARAVESKYFWQPIGYPAAPFPMGKSVAEGRAEANRQCNRMETGFRHRERIERHGVALAGYSQGAIVVGEMWEYDIKSETGALHWMLPHVRKAVTWGNPMREKDKAWPDPGGQIAKAGSHGIADQLMVDTPLWWRNYAHKGDIYTEQSGEAGEHSTAIYKMIMGVRVFSGEDSIIRQLLELGLDPFGGGLAAAWALLNAGLFFGGGTTSHTNYNISVAIDYLMSP